MTLLEATTPNSATITGLMWALVLVALFAGYILAQARQDNQR